MFKTLIDPFAGKLSIMRVMSGKIAPDVTCYVPRRQVKEKIGHLFRLEGKKQEAVKEAVGRRNRRSGEIQRHRHRRYVVRRKGADPLSTARRISRRIISFALEPKSKADEDKLPQGLHRMMEEDQTIEMHRDEETRDFILSGMGQQHIEIIVEKLKRKYGAEVILKAPKVPYKETIRGSASAQGRLKKQTGGRGQFGDTWLKVEPLPAGKGFEFVDQIVGGAIPRNYIPGCRERRERGDGGRLSGRLSDGRCAGDLVRRVVP